MVAVTVEEALAMKRRMDGGDAAEMTTWQRSIIGQSVRLEIPLRDPYLLRKVHPILSALAEHIRIQSARVDINEYEIMMSIRLQCRMATKQIQELHGGANKNGTYPKKRMY